MENSLKIDTFCSRLTNKGRSRNTIAMYKFILTQFFSQYTTKNWSEITNEDIENYIQWKTDKSIERKTTNKTGRGFGRMIDGVGKLKQSTINLSLSALRKFFFFCEMNALAENIELGKVERWIPQEIDLDLIESIFKNKNITELKSIVKDTMKKKNKNHDEVIDQFYIDRNALCFYLLFNLGLRIGECTNLKKESLKFNLTQPTIIVTGKTGQRTIPVSQTIVDEVNNYIHVYPIVDYIFIRKTGGVLSVNTLKTYIWEIFRIGLETKYHAHSLRHAFATFLIDRGEAIQDVQQLMGHSSMNTTAAYLDSIKGRVKKSSNPIDFM